MTTKTSCRVKILKFDLFYTCMFRTLVKSVKRKFNFLISQPKHMFGYSEEPSYEHPKQMLKLMGKKIFTLFAENFRLSKFMYVSVTMDAEKDEVMEEAQEDCDKEMPNIW